MPSDLRCPWFESRICLSCDLLDLAYGEQLERKTQLLKPAAMQFGAELPPMSPAPSPMGSRIKAKMVVFGAAGDPRFGAADSSSNTVALENCPSHHPAVNELLSAAQDALRQASVTPYDIKKRQGELKYIIVRYSEKTGESLVRFVARSKSELKKLKQAAGRLQESDPRARVVSLNIQPRPAAVLEGAEEMLLAGPNFITDRIAERTVYFGPRSFTQTNTGVAEELYLTALEKSSLVLTSPRSL